MVSAIAAKRQRTELLAAPKRITLGAGRSVREVIAKLDDVCPALAARIENHHGSSQRRLNKCLDLFADSRRRRIVRLIASRKALTLRSSALATAMWEIGSVVAAPMIGSHGSPDPEREARGNAKLLEETLRGERLRFGDAAFVHRRTEPTDFPTAEMDYHWHNTDIALMSCGDLMDHWFGGFGRVSLPPDLYAELSTRGACGDLCGLYFDGGGNCIEPSVYRRLGMGLDDLRAVAQGGDGRASILVAGGDVIDDAGSMFEAMSPGTTATCPGESTLPRARTVLAALLSGAVSVLITDCVYATAVLRLHAQDVACGAATVSR
jgi:hypothetical protein